MIEADHECRDIATLEDLRKLLFDGENLEFCSVEEERQLRNCIVMIEKVKDELSRVVHAVQSFTQKVESTIQSVYLNECIGFDFTASLKGILYLENMSSRLGFGTRIRKSCSPLYVNNKLTVSSENNSLPITITNSFRKFSYNETVAKAHLQKSGNLFKEDKVKCDSKAVGSEEENLASMKTFLNTNKTVTIQHLINLMECCSLIPVVVNDAKYVQWLLDMSSEYQFIMQAVLAKYSMLKMTKSKSILEKPRLSMSEIVDLRDIVLYCCPIYVPEFVDVNLLVVEAMTWRKDVYAINGCSPPSSKILFETLTVHSCTADMEIVNVAVNSAAHKSVPLKKVDLLLTNGEKFPINFETEIVLLKEKKQQAKLWLEKLKKSFVSTKVVSARRSKAGDKDNNVNLQLLAGTLPEKLKLSDMKQMVFEGELLYNSSEESLSSGRTLNRELDKALNVVESAEDWIGRVRELLMSDFSSDYHDERFDDQNMFDIVDIEEDSSGKNGKKYDQKSLQLQTMSFLNTLLSEAEQMPVVLEEASILRVHLNALEWAAKVRPYLCFFARKPSAIFDLNDLQTDKNLYVKMGRLVGEEDINQCIKPLLSDIQAFANDITKWGFIYIYFFVTVTFFFCRIRSCLSDDVHAEFPFRPLPEETACLDLLSSAEQWLSRIKKLTVHVRSFKLVAVLFYFAF